MIRYGAVLLEIWREVCQHLEIEEAVARLAPLLADRLPADFLFVRRFDPKRSLVETVASGGYQNENLTARTRCDCPDSAMQEILVWSESRDILQMHSSRFQPSLAHLIPEGIEGEVLAGALQGAEGPAGVLVLVARRGFRKQHAELFETLLEPFAVALENDHRVRELNALREAVEADNRSLLSRLGRHDISESIVGAEAGLKPVMEQIELVARSSAPVLLLGETGSGKEVVARAIHTRSVRVSKPFLRVNCGAIPPDLVDSELFGHERGSFTGATSVRKGWFERADGGTLFLDECGELPPAAQVRLLRILQDGVFERVGGERSLSVDVRIVAATHRDLQAMVAAGRFREDLWYRIAVFPIRLPPLRDRVEDIPALATHFALRAANRLGVPALIPGPEDMGLLVAYPWPGNVRELAAVIERAAILGDGKHLDVAKALGGVISQDPPRQSTLLPSTTAPGKLATLDEAMASHIEAALGRTHGRIEGPNGAAKVLGINPHTLRARMRKLGIVWDKFRHREGG